MEGDRHSVVVAVAKPTSHLLDHLDLAVEAFGCGVGGVKLEVGQDIGQACLCDPQTGVYAGSWPP